VIVFLDTNIVIYLIENPPVFGPRAAAHLTALRTALHAFAVSDLVRLECRVQPMRRADHRLLGQYDAFFASPEVQVLPLTAAVCDRATLLRATHNFQTPDALQLAAAVVHGCDRFLTNDNRLSACTDIAVDVLP
jgi:predicted nucleic acid-binding protein